MPKLNTLYIEDDDAAYFLVQTAIAEACVSVHLFRVSDGEQAIEFLLKQGSYASAPEPDLILLDLNLPRVHGFEVLSYVQNTESLRRIPVDILTTSSARQDKERSLALGARRFFTKPQSFDGLVALIRLIFRPIAETDSPNMS